MPLNFDAAFVTRRAFWGFITGLCGKYHIRGSTISRNLYQYQLIKTDHRVALLVCLFVVVVVEIQDGL